MQDVLSADATIQAGGCMCLCARSERSCIAHILVVSSYSHASETLSPIELLVVLMYSCGFTNSLPSLCRLC